MARRIKTSRAASGSVIVAPGAVALTFSAARLALAFDAKASPDVATLTLLRSFSRHRHLFAESWKSSKRAAISLNVPCARSCNANIGSRAQGGRKRIRPFTLPHARVPSNRTALDRAGPVSGGSVVRLCALDEG